MPALISQKKLSQFLALLILAGFFAVAVFLLDRKQAALNLGLEKQPATEITKTEASNQSDLQKIRPAVPDVTLQDFKRNSLKDGKLLWELTGKTIDLYSDQDLLEIKNPELLSYQQSNNPLQVAGQEALVLFQANQIKEVELTKSVSIKNNTYRILSEQAKFNQSKNIITSDRAVEIYKDRNIIKGVGLHANLNNEVFDIKSKVDSLLFDPKKKSTFKITSQQLTFDNTNLIFTYSGDVVATDGIYLIKSDRLTGNLTSDQELKKLFASGSVVITKGEELRTFSEKADFDFQKNQIILTEDPELEKDNSVLSADVIYYNTETNQSRAEGEVQVKILDSAKPNNTQSAQ